MDYQPAHSLLGCPVEVCQSVFSYLSRNDLINLCLVHSNLRIVAEPYLYRSINFTWEKRLQPHPITSLLCSLLRRPQLATYVKTVSLTGSRFHNPTMERRAPKIEVTENELNEILSFVEHTAVPFRWTWLEELRTGTMDAFIAVLLSQPLTITFLFIGGDFLWESHFIGLVFRSTILDSDAYECGLRLQLRYLETVSLQSPVDRFRFNNNARNTADILPMFYLPSLKRLFASIDNPLEFSWPGMFRPSPLSLRELKLERIREPFLGQILSVTDQLRSLHWKWYYYEHIYDQTYHMRILDLTQVTNSILYVRETLTELTISAVNENDPDPLPLTIRGSVKGLARFKRLKNLTLPFIFLIGTWSTNPINRLEDCLPRSLERLIITDNLATNDECRWWDDDEDLLAVVEAWLKNYQASTPHLRELQIPICDMAAHAQRLSGITNEVVTIRLEKV